MNYTKGEWTAYKDPLTLNSYAIDIKHTGKEKTFKEIAIVFSENDAQLIAAAPELYEALKALSYAPLSTAQTNMLDKAIAKAERKP